MAEASCTCSKTKSYADFIDRTAFPLIPFQRVEKEPGSKKLVCGNWVTVKPKDDDAIKGARTP